MKDSTKLGGLKDMGTHPVCSFLFVNEPGLDWKWRAPGLSQEAVVQYGKYFPWFIRCLNTTPTLQLSQLFMGTSQMYKYIKSSVHTTVNTVLKTPGFLQWNKNVTYLFYLKHNIRIKHNNTYGNRWWRYLLYLLYLHRNIVGPMYVTWVWDIHTFVHLNQTSMFTVLYVK